MSLSSDEQGMGAEGLGESDQEPDLWSAVGPADVSPAAASISEVDLEKLHKRALRIDRERQRLEEAVQKSRLDTLQERVAWVLNYYPEARDSDFRLQVEFWKTFTPELVPGGRVHLDDYARLAPLTSIVRARAKIQNEYKLFQASPEVREYRGTLETEEREKARAQKQTYPLFSVFADESGKNADHLIVGSIWILHPPEVLRLTIDAQRWRKERRFDDEFHFKDIDGANLPTYLEFAEWMVAASAVVSFRSMSVERRGIGRQDQALEELYYHLLLEGVDHEHHTGRAPLPRSLALTKDLEEQGRDNLFLAGLRDALLQATSGRFGGQLSVDSLRADDSKGQVLLQMADLYTGSINRILNVEANPGNPKYEFATYLLSQLGMPGGPDTLIVFGDVTAHMRL